MRHALVASGAVLLGVASAAVPAPAHALRFLGSANSTARCAQAEARLDANEQASLQACGDATGCTPQGERRHARLARTFANRCVAINHVQVLGSHNSYHVQPREPFFSTIVDLDAAALAWEYTHLPLGWQFQEQGIRQIELDVYADPAGGLYTARKGPILLGLDPIPAPPELFLPGMKVLHVQDLDFEATCFTFVDCLTAVKTWSDTHPHHMPIMIQVEVKDDVFPGLTRPIRFDTTQFDALDAEIRSVFPPKRVITPDKVRGRTATLDQAIHARGWPTLGSARGKVLFTLDNGGSYRQSYLAGHPALQGRILFTDAPPGSADGAFVKENDPLADPARIPALVTQGYLVRTRADADTMQARSGDVTQRDAAIASGAQFVSTDYPVPNPAFGTGYFVGIPGGAPARCNPVSTPAACRATALERLP